MLSIGQRLAQARNARGITHEDAAFHTRIPVALVRDLENDDLSHFANLTYAKGFLKIYSRYLDIDITEYLDQFSTSDFAQAASREYVETANATHNLPTAVFTDYSRARRPGVYVLVAFVLALGGFFYWRSQVDEKQDNDDRTAAAASASRNEVSPAKPSDPAPPPAPAVATVPAPAPVNSIPAAVPDAPTETPAPAPEPTPEPEPTAAPAVEPVAEPAGVGRDVAQREQPLAQPGHRQREADHAHSRMPGARHRARHRRRVVLLRAGELTHLWPRAGR